MNAIVEQEFATHHEESTKLLHWTRQNAAKIQIQPTVADSMLKIS